MIAHRESLIVGVANAVGQGSQSTSTQLKQMLAGHLRYSSSRGLELESPALGELAILVKTKKKKKSLKSNKP